MRIFLVAGEPSGDKLGAALMAGLRGLVPDISFDGIGGPAMQSQGLQSLFPMEELSVMGIAEVLPKYFHLKRRIRQTADAVLQAAPDALITIDSPDFCLRVAKIVKAARPAQRTIHYVAPTVWAWRPGRAAKMAKVIDHVLALFPFEPPYMEKAGMGCDFVGHPVVSEPAASDAEIADLRDIIGRNGPVILALPGSRRGEVSRLAPIFGESWRRVMTAHPNARVVVPTVPHLTETVTALTGSWSSDRLILDAGARPDLERAAVATADVALAASGTVSLELAAADTPMVIAYDMNWLSRRMISRMLLIDTVTLVNLVSETRAVPEFIGANCRAELIAPAILSVLEQPAAQRDAMATTIDRLGRGGPAQGERAAQAVMRVIADRAC